MSACHAVNSTFLAHNNVWQDIEHVARTGGQGLGLWNESCPRGLMPPVAAWIREAGLTATYQAM